MRVTASILLLALAVSVSALEPGKRYNFYSKNGQNVLGAELIEETDDSYTVKLPYIPKPITLSKSSLISLPVLTNPPKTESRDEMQMQAHFLVHGGAGVSYLTFGQLSGTFATGLHASLGADWRLFSKPFYRIHALTIMATWARYANGTRSLQAFSGLMGPKFLIWKFERGGFACFASPLLGASAVALQGYTFASNYVTISALGQLGVEKQMGPIALSLQFFLNYVADNSQSFSSTGGSVSVLYPLGAATFY
jgi:hypothetical protein